MDQPPRLRAKTWVEACLLSCRSAGVMATVLARGDGDGGVVLLKWRRPDGHGGVLTPLTTLDGARAWMLGTGLEPLTEAEVDAYWQRQRDRDPDMWILEIESATLWHPLDEQIANAADPVGANDPTRAAAALFKR